MNLQEQISRIQSMMGLTELHKVKKDEYVELYRDDDFILTIPLTHSASKKYGSDTKWCTTKRDCDIDFNKHIELGVLGYIVVRNNELKEKLNNNAFALYRLKGDNVSRTIVFDDENNEYRNGESWLANKFDRIDKLFQFYRMMNKFNEYFENTTKTQSMMGTINESKQLPNFIKRRFTENELDSEFYDALDYAKRLLNNTGVYSRTERTLENYIRATISVLIDNLHVTLTDTLPQDVQWYETVENVLKDYYRDEITKEYNSMSK
jgi:hypothetical protein